ncbi:MAG: fibronectin type III domain-containing protein [Flavobacteriales bacterium]
MVTRSTGVLFNDISGTGFAVDSWRYTGGFSQDDNRSFPVPIGFQFWYNALPYTTICISTNGFIDFSSSADDGGPSPDAFGYVNSAFSQSSAALATRPAIAPFYDDLTAQGGVNPLGTSIQYITTGSAGNRVFTVQWTNMAIYGNTSPSLTFQVKLYETSGIIEMHYSTMNAGSHTFSYTCGINAPVVGNPPTAAQLLTQQNANTAIFNATPQNSLSQMPAANSLIRFTPQVPQNPISALSFSAVSRTSMTINWTNWATNEDGYALYYSIDGTTFFYFNLVGANITTFNATGLLPGIQYHWRVVAFTEGAVSSPSIGSQITLPPGTVISAQSGNWNTGSTWQGGQIPTAGDNVIIQNTHTVTVNTTNSLSPAICNDLQIGQGAGGTLRFGINGSPVYLRVNSNLIVNAGGSFSVPTNSNNQSNLFTINGKILNNGIIDFNPDNNSFAIIDFVRNATQSITGTGSLSRFYTIRLNIGNSVADRLDVSVSNFSAPTGFLELNTGTFHYEGTQNLVISLSSGNFLVPRNTGIWLDGANASFIFSQNLTVQGLLKVSKGTVQVGAGNNFQLISDGGEVSVENTGIINVSAAYTNRNQNAISKFSITGGRFVVPSNNNTTNGMAPFSITSPGARFTQTGGTILIRSSGGTGGQNLGYRVTGVAQSTVTGGTLQIGNASTGNNTTIGINSTAPVANLLVDRTTCTAILQTNPLNVVQDITINAGTLNANNLSISIGGNWTDNSAFTSGNATVLFSGSGAQFINDPNGETFNNIVFGGSGITTTNTDLTVNGNLTILSAFDVSAANRHIVLRRNWINNGVFVQRQGNVTLNGSVAQTMSGSSTTTFYDLTINNSSGVSIPSGNFAVADAYFPTAGQLSNSASGSFTFLSDANRTARIAPRISGTLAGNFIVQRHISTRAAGYSDMASPLTTTTFQDWSNEMLLVFGYNPPYMYPSAWSYSESLFDYVPVTSASTILTPGKGYEVWLDSDGSYTSFDATTIDSRGLPNMGDVNVSSQLTRVNDGWNLVGNPYASFISLNSLIASSSGIGNSIMIYDEVLGDFQVFSVGSGVEIAPHQGFWVNATSPSPFLQFSETHKTTAVSSTYRSSNSAFTLRCEKSAAEMKFSSGTSFTFFSNDENEKDDLDVSFVKVPHPEAPALFSIYGGKFLRNNNLTSTGEYQIPVYCKVGLAGEYTITVSHYEELLSAGYTCAVLFDKLTNTEINLNSESSYRFYSEPSHNPNRFILVLSRKGNCKITETNALTEGSVFFRQQADGILVNLALEGDGLAEVSMYDLNGKLISSRKSVAVISSTLVNRPESAGMYLVVVIQGNRKWVEKYIVTE